MLILRQTAPLTLHFCDRKMTMEHQRLVTSGPDTHLILDVTEIRYDNKNDSRDIRFCHSISLRCKKIRNGVQLYCEVTFSPWCHGVDKRQKSTYVPADQKQMCDIVGYIYSV